MTDGLGRSDRVLPTHGEPPLVFLNYRSEGESSLATLLDETLSAELGRDVVFLDYRSITLGQDFEPALLAAVRQVAVLLVLIGQDWLRADATGRRLIDDPADWVRREIVEALAANVLVVPVLVGERPKLRADELPADLRIIARLQYTRIRHRHQPQDIGHLIALLLAQSPRLANRAGRAVREKPPQPGPRRAFRLTAAVVLVLVMEWFVTASAISSRARPPESGDPVSLVGTPSVRGGLEYARPTPLTSGPEHDDLVDTDHPAYQPLTDDDYVTVGTLTLSFQVKGNRRMPVQVTDIAPDVAEAAPVLSGTLVVFPPPGGERPAISLVSSLDDPRRVVRAQAELTTPWFSRHHVELAEDENQQFEITFTGRLAAYAFRVVVTYVDDDGAPARLVVAGEGGEPFRLTGKPADGKYEAVYLPNFPRSGGWHPCGEWPEDRCPG